MIKSLVNTVDKLYVKFDVPETFQEFIYKLYIEGHYKHTFFDKECISPQKIGFYGWRSIKDICTLILTYYPDTNPRDIVIWFMNNNIWFMNNKVSVMSFNFYHCKTINRAVISIYYDSDHRDSYYNYYSYESWKKIFDELNITKEDYIE